MNNSITQLLGRILSVVKIALALTLTIVIIALPLWLLYELFMLLRIANTEIHAALLGLFGVTLAAIFSHYFSQKREISSRQFTQKAKAYENIFNFVVEVVGKSDSGDQMNELEIGERSRSIRKDIMVWASDDVIKAWSDYEMAIGKYGKNTNVFKYMDLIFRALRKDLGHSDKKLLRGDLIKMMVTPSEHDKVDEQIQSLSDEV